MPREKLVGRDVIGAGGGGGGCDAGGGGGGGRRPATDCCRVETLRLRASTVRPIGSMLRANCSITPAKPSRVRAVPEVSESSEDADGIGTDDTGVGRTPEDCGAVDIVLEISDTKVIGTLVLPGTDLRLYEWEGGSRGLSE